MCIWFNQAPSSLNLDIAHLVGKRRAHSNNIAPLTDLERVGVVGGRLSKSVAPLHLPRISVRWILLRGGDFGIQIVQKTRMLSGIVSQRWDAFLNEDSLSQPQPGHFHYYRPQT